MTPTYRFAALIFGLTVLVALVLHFRSEDYRFSPEVSQTEETAPSIAEPAPTVIPADRALELLRVTGAAEPGDVEVQALLLNLLQPTEEPILVIKIALNTHSVSLRGVDIARQAYIENSKGIKVQTGICWKTEHNQGYHHIMGYLIVPNRESTGSLIAEDVSWIKLVLHDIPKIDHREFLWERTDI